MDRGLPDVEAASEAGQRLRVLAVRAEDAGDVGVADAGEAHDMEAVHEARADKADAKALSGHAHLDPDRRRGEDRAKMTQRQPVAVAGRRRPVAHSKSHSQAGA